MLGTGDGVGLGAATGGGFGLMASSGDGVGLVMGAANPTPTATALAANAAPEGNRVDHLLERWSPTGRARR